MSQKDTVDANITRKKKAKTKKEKKIKIEISLWINSVKYEFGVLCTFCTKITAVCHCPECPDFYCPSCDVTAHNTKKRKDHKRTPLSKLNLHTAAHLITRAVRYNGHLRMLQDRCRKTFKRFFDRKTLNYYYYNPIYDIVSWRRPYCLRHLEFAPYMEPNYAASKCQNLYRGWLARDKVRKEIATQYRKIFDRRSGRFYYAFNGPSKLLSKSSWRKPRYLGKRSYPKDILPIFTLDVAVITIQRKWRAILLRTYLRALVRAAYDEVWDPVHGRFNYFHVETEILYVDKPLLLRSEPWDPNRIPDWSIDRVALFMRRIGLKQYLDTFRAYEVDGKTLILLDAEDYENLKITNRVHIRKIQVEITKLWRSTVKQETMSATHFERRERIRRSKMFQAAAILIQKNYRVYLAKNELHMRRELFRLKQAEAELAARIAASNTWYTEKEELPSKRLGTNGSTETKTGLKLPPIKTFGRHQDYLSVRGWGRRGDGVKGDWVPTPASVLDKDFLGDTALSRIYTDKLHIKGYDSKRLRQFKGLPDEF